MSSAPTVTASTAREKEKPNAREDYRTPEKQSRGEYPEFPGEHVLNGGTENADVNITGTANNRNQ